MHIRPLHAFSFVIAMLSTVHPVAGEGGAPSAAKGPPGRFFKVDPVGAFCPQPPPVPAPSSIPFSTLKLQPNDYLGIRVFGEYNVYLPCPTPPCPYADLKTTWAVIRGSSGFLSPGNYGNQGPSPLSCGNVIAHFVVGESRYSVLRLPIGAGDLRITPTNEHEWRNRTDLDKNYGVRITRPNSPPLAPKTPLIADAHPQVSVSSRKIPDSIIRKMLEKARTDPRVPDIAPNIARDQIAQVLATSTEPPVPNPQYRGWYVCTTATKSCWSPGSSRFEDRPSRHHYGVDIFAPQDSIVVAPVGGVLRVFNSQTFGLTAYIAFYVNKEVNKEPYILLFAHLAKLKASANKLVEKGQEIAYAGCGGNAIKEWCGRESPEGGRSDHVHVELIVGTKLPSPTYKPKRLDPNTALSWGIAIPK